MAWIHQLIDFSLLFFIISLLSPSFYLVPPVSFTSSSSLSSMLLFLIGIPLHHHRYTSFSLVYLFVIGIPLHHRYHSHLYFVSIFFLPFHPLFIHLHILKKHFAGQMPSKRAKYSPKILFFMRYSEICLIGGCLIGGAYQQRNKERKVGTFHIMP